MATSSQQLAVEIVTKGAEKAKADLADIDKTAKELGDKPIEIPVKPVDLPGADTTKAKVDELSHSAEGSRNAFANLVGNSAQDLGGMLGPLGSVGVAVGQVAEYTSDAALGGESMTTALAGAASMALPMAGLSAALFVVTKAVEDYQKRQAEIKKAQADGTKAFEEATGAVDQWGKALDDAFATGTADKIETLNKVIKDALGKETTSEVLQNLGQIGKTSDDLGTTMLAVDENFRGYAVTALTAAGVTDKLANSMVDMIKTSDNTNHALGQIKDTGIDVDKMGIRDLVTGLADLNGEARKQDFDKYAESALNSAAAIKETSAAANEARDAGGTATEQWQRYEEGQNRAKVAAQENARAQEEGARLTQESGSIVDQVGRQVAEAADLSAAAADKARDAQDRWLGKVVTYPDAVDNLTESVLRLTDQTAAQIAKGDEGAASFDGNSKAALSNRDAMRDVYSAAKDVIDAYADQGATSADVAQKTTEQANAAYDLAIKNGLSEDAAAQLRDTILTVPTSRTTEMEYQERNYGQMLDHRDTLEADMHSTLYMHGVVDQSIVNAVNGLPPGTIPGSRAVAPVTAPAAVPLGVSAFAAPTATATTTRAATVNVNLQGAVVADTFQLQRVVSRAVRQGTRLNGTRRY